MLNVHSLFHRSMRRISSDGATDKPAAERPEAQAEAPERKAWHHTIGCLQRDSDELPLRAMGISARLGA